MKGSLVVVAFFCAGCMIGAVNNFQYDMHSVSMYVLLCTDAPSRNQHRQQ